MLTLVLEQVPGRLYSNIMLPHIQYVQHVAARWNANVLPPATLHLHGNSSMSKGQQLSGVGGYLPGPAVSGVSLAVEIQQALKRGTFNDDATGNSRSYDGDKSERGGRISAAL